jgi:heptaprenyl diphosphate synthase
MAAENLVGFGYVDTQRRGNQHDEPAEPLGLTIGAPAQAGGRLAEIIAQPELRADLEQVEARMVERSASHSPQIDAAGLHAVSSGGKRLRALLALLAAKLGSYTLERTINAAAAAELIHAASLIHDDLVDGAAQRRGKVTVHTRWGSDVALMVGDYFFALASYEMALAPDSRIIAIYAQAVRTIVEGELSPVLAVEPLEQALEQYLHKTGSKTAALFAAACQAGMLCGRGDEAQVTALGRFGYDLGIAFQIVDDVLDYTGDEQTLGKPAGNDLRQGTITLPLIYAVANGAPSALASVLDEPEPDAALVAATIAEVRRWRGIDDAQATAEHYATRARTHLDIFPASPARDALIALTQFVVERSS